MKNLFSLQHNNKTMRWCLTADCSYAARKITSTAKSPCSCKCGYDFCFDCREFWHEPVTCVRLNRWKKSESDDTETRKWIAEHAKPCPQCQAKIEKNGGCHHMVTIQYNPLSLCTIQCFPLKKKIIQFL